MLFIACSIGIDRDAYQIMCSQPSNGHQADLGDIPALIRFRFYFSSAQFVISYFRDILSYHFGWLQLVVLNVLKTLFVLSLYLVHSIITILEQQEFSYVIYHMGFSYSCQQQRDYNQFEAHAYDTPISGKRLPLGSISSVSFCLPVCTK